MLRVSSPTPGENLDIEKKEKDDLIEEKVEEEQVEDDLIGEEQVEGNVVEEKVDNVEVEKDLVIHVSIANEFNKSLGTSIILFRSAFHETHGWLPCLPPVSCLLNKPRWL